MQSKLKDLCSVQPRESGENCGSEHGAARGLTYKAAGLQCKTLHLHCARGIKCDSTDICFGKSSLRRKDKCCPTELSAMREITYIRTVQYGSH